MTGHTEAARAYRRLRDMIIRAELAPGAALYEADLMQAIGVGRTPLRDALHRLAHEGLVEILPRRGTFVSEVTIADLQQIFEVAWPFEELVARLTAERCTPNDLAELGRLIERQAQVPTERGATNEVDGELYRLLLRIAGNRFLADAYQRCWDASLRLRYLTGCGRESHAEQRGFLQAVAAALAARDATRLCDLLHGHLASFRERVAASIFSAGGVSARAS